MFCETLKKQWGTVLVTAVLCENCCDRVMQFELAHLKKKKEEEENILPFGGFNGLVDAEFEITARHR